MPDNATEGVGQAEKYKEVVEKYDAEHGTYKDNVPREPNLPNAQPAGPDPSPFKIGQ